MKEQRIEISIYGDGKIAADAHGFSGDACLKDLEKLLEGIASGPASVKRKVDPKIATTTTTRTQALGGQT